MSTKHRMPGLLICVISLGCGGGAVTKPELPTPEPAATPVAHASATASTPTQSASSQKDIGTRIEAFAVDDWDCPAKLVSVDAALSMPKGLEVNTSKLYGMAGETHGVMFGGSRAALKRWFDGLKLQDLHLTKTATSTGCAEPQSQFSRRQPSRLRAPGRLLGSPVSSTWHSC